MCKTFPIYWVIRFVNSIYTKVKILGLVTHWIDMKCNGLMYGWSRLLYTLCYMFIVVTCVTKSVGFLKFNGFIDVLCIRTSITTNAHVLLILPLYVGTFYVGHCWYSVFQLVKVIQNRTEPYLFFSNRNIHELKTIWKLFPPITKISIFLNNILEF